MTNSNNFIDEKINDNMKIGLIGLGVVGAAVKFGMELIGHKVFVYDIKYPETSIKDVLGTELCFLCLPTQTNEDGKNDTSIVEKVVSKLSQANYKGIVTIKSTVIPGATDRLAKKYPNLRFAFCPEFLRERAAVIDFVENHDVCAIGVYNDRDYQIIKNAHGRLPKNFSKLTPKEAEFVKYFSNTFNALRIVFANEFYEVCKSAGANYTRIKDCVVKKENTPNVYLDCHENLRGFGGPCLPKDTLAFASFVKDLGLNLKLFETIVEENKKFPKTILKGMRSN